MSEFEKVLELKHCPFCDGVAWATQEDNCGHDYDEWFVWCPRCDLLFGFGNHFQTKEEAIKAWNKRANIF